MILYIVLGLVCYVLVAAISAWIARVRYIMLEDEAAKFGMGWPYWWFYVLMINATRIPNPVNVLVELVKRVAPK